MTVRRLLLLASVFVLACVTMVTMQAQGGARQGGAGAPAQGQGGRRGGGGGGGGAGFGVGTEGTLINGQWGAKALSPDSRGWGYMSKSYVSPDYKRPFYNKAKELLFSDKQVTSYTVSRGDPQLYCEVRKHYGYVWFEMQHSTMSWADIEKMIAACPGPDGAAPFVRMPDQMESTIQKATDIGNIGLIFPTMRDGHQR